MLAREIPKLNNNDIIRLISKISFTKDCWLWQGEKNVGYGLYCIAGKCFRAHRVSYEFFRREKIPLDMVLDHLCRRKSCVNPFHLEIVTVKENNLRGVGSPAQNARKVCCKRGHPFVGRNLKIIRGQRACRTCLNLNQKMFQDKRRKELARNLA